MRSRTSRSLRVIATVALTLFLFVWCATPVVYAQETAGGALDGGNSLAQSASAPRSSQAASSANSQCFSLDDPQADSKAAAGIPPCSPSVSPSAGNSMNGGTGGGLSGGSQISGGLGGKLNPQAMSAVMQRMGISADEIGSLKNQLASGSLSPDELQELCLHFASKQLGPNDVEGIASSLGLSLTAEQLAQLKSCTRLAQPQATAGQASAREQAAASPSAASNQVSSIEQTFRGLDSGAAPQAPSTANLSQFGYSLFSSGSVSAAASADLPVGSKYVLGPGDELKVLMWGRINNTLDLKVARDGSVLIPEIGPMQLAGLTFEQAKKVIEGRTGQITGVNVDVTMGRLRSIQVFVVGEVARPGAYQVSALAHVANALEAAGGITKIGSLRRIELRRGNQVSKSIDLYGLLLNGRNSAEDQLEPGDVIFVPVIGSVAAVTGDVKRPAIYELAGNSESLASLLKLSGGISAFGYSQRVQVERVENHQKRIALDVDLNAIRSQNFMIHDGDLVKIYPVLPTEHEVVVAFGNLNRPGKYQWHAGMRVSDLVAAAEGPAPHTFFRYALIRRKEGPSKAVHLVPVDLGQALSDHLAGPANLALEPEDQLTIYSESQMKYLPTVQVMGEVRNPGYYVLSQGMRVTDLLYLAGGLKDDAYQKQAELARTQVVNGAHTSHTFLDIDLRTALSGSGAQNPELEPNDQLFVQKATDWHLPWVVYVRGRVARPGPYTIHAGERIATVLERCGGLMPDAYLPAAVLIRQSVKEMQQARLNQARTRLQEAILRAKMNPGTSATLSQTPDNSGNDATLTMLQQVLSQSESQQAQGRLVVHLKPLDELVNTPDNIAMVDQDILTIPRRPAGVNVLGQVYSPSAIVWQPGRTVRDFLNMAGGPTEGADSDHVMLIKADGAVETDQGIRDSKESTMFPLLPVISGGLMSARVDPGDTVYVPEKLVYVNKLQVASTVTQVIAQSMMSIATLGILASTL
jgi:protein involved in polysaccharide export with SLBB domain